ncbi:hypothetical protein CK203_023977 [Vitis vinifera]|uniref:Retrovirus-related Pol polyprotein from transposon RE1 n=1 Tax=Vitis vinifera TaxID=29760 RepID=A0A438IQ33_VITVI|nr:hypothetical protein CK203_023977 [Vitis vinifera]
MKTPKNYQKLGTPLLHWFSVIGCLDIAISMLIYFARLAYADIVPCITTRAIRRAGLNVAEDISPDQTCFAVKDLEFIALFLGLPRGRATWPFFICVIVESGARISVAKITSLDLPTHLVLEMRIWHYENGKQFFTFQHFRTCPANFVNTEGSVLTIGELVTGRDQILQLLGGLGADYNSMVALLTAHEDDISLHSIHGILLTHEQRLCFQNLVVENDVIATNIATSQYQDHNNKKNQNCNNFIPNKNDYGHKPSRRSNGGPSQDLPPLTTLTAIHKSTNNNTQMQAMLPSPSTPSNDAWFFDTRATHRLTQEVSSLINVQPYKGKGQVIVGNGKQILILNIGTKSIPFTL